MATQEITISEGLVWLKTLQARHRELVDLRDSNSVKETRLYGQKDKEVIKEVLYDCVKLDTLINQLAREIRLLDSSIKKTNATTPIKDYRMEEDKLGNLEAMKKE